LRVICMGGCRFERVMDEGLRIGEINHGLQRMLGEKKLRVKD
jgi:hypothetical protein